MNLSFGKLCSQLMVEIDSLDICVYSIFYLNFKAINKLFVYGGKIIHL